MNFSELGRVIEQLGKDRGIKKEFIVGAIEQAFLVTARKKFGIQGEYEARYNETDGEVEIYQYKNVVDKVRDPIVEIDFDAAIVAVAIRPGLGETAASGNPALVELFIETQWLWFGQPGQDGGSRLQGGGERRAGFLEILLGDVGHIDDYCAASLAKALTTSGGA